MSQEAEEAIVKKQEEKKKKLNEDSDSDEEDKKEVGSVTYVLNLQKNERIPNVLLERQVFHLFQFLNLSIVYM